MEIRRLILIFVILGHTTMVGFAQESKGEGVYLRFHPEEGRTYRGLFEIGTQGGSNDVVMTFGSSLRSEGEGFIKQQLDSLYFSLRDEVIFDSKLQDSEQDMDEDRFLFNSFLNKDLEYEIDEMGRITGTPDPSVLYPSEKELKEIFSDYDERDIQYFMQDLTETYDSMENNFNPGQLTYPQGLIYEGDSWYGAKKQRLEGNYYWTESWYTLDRITRDRIYLTIEGRMIKTDQRDSQMTLEAEITGTAELERSTGVLLHQNLCTTQEIQTYWNSPTITTWLIYRDLDLYEPFKIKKKLALFESLDFFRRQVEQLRNEEREPYVSPDPEGLSQQPINDYFFNLFNSTKKNDVEKFEESLTVISHGLGGDSWHIPERTWFEFEGNLIFSDGREVSTSWPEEFLNLWTLGLLFYEDPIYDYETLKGEIKVFTEKSGETLILDQNNLTIPGGSIEILEKGKGWMLIHIDADYPWSASFNNCTAMAHTNYAAWMNEPFSAWDESGIVYLLRDGEQSFLPEITLSWSFWEESAPVDISPSRHILGRYFPEGFDPGYGHLTSADLKGYFTCTEGEGFSYEISLPPYANTIHAKLTLSEKLIHLFQEDCDFSIEFDPFSNSLIIESSADLSGQIFTILYPKDVGIKRYEKGETPAFDQLEEWSDDKIVINIPDYMEDLQSPFLVLWNDHNRQIIRSYEDSYFPLVIRPLNSHGEQLLPLSRQGGRSDFTMEYSHEDEMTALDVDEPENWQTIRVKIP